MQVTPLHLAAARGHVDVVRRLIELNADVKAKDARNYTPFLSASLGVPEVEVALVAADVELGEMLKDKKKKGKGAKKGAKRR
jgi:ankyrin repeat protein